MWNVTVVNGLQASFNQPDGPSRHGYDWIVMLSRGSDQKRTMIRTYSDQYSSLPAQALATVAVDFVKQQINDGWDPCDKAEPPETVVPDNFLASRISTMETTPQTEQQQEKPWWRFW